MKNQLKKHSFKVGDWVIFKNIEDAYYSMNKRLNNKIGKIVYVDHTSRYWPYCVEFVDKVIEEGSEYGGFESKKGHCLYCKKNNLKPYSPVLKKFLKDKKK